MKRSGRVAMSVGLGVATFVVVWVVVTWLGHRGEERANARNDEVAVLAAANARRGTQVAVRGFVFIDAHVGTLLCSARATGKRPACKGDVLTLVDLDTSRIPLERATVKAGGYDAWSDGQVVLLGTTEGPTFVVKDVLPG